MNDGEYSLVKWQYHRAGDFTNALFGALMRADQHNLNRFKLAFPEETEAYDRYAHEPGYWDALKKESGMENL